MAPPRGREFPGVRRAPGASDYSQARAGLNGTLVLDRRGRSGTGGGRGRGRARAARGAAVGRSATSIERRGLGERGFGAGVVAFLRARLADQAPVGGAQRQVLARERVRLGRELRRARGLTLVQIYARELVPERGVARLDTQRPLDVRGGGGEAPGADFLAGVLHERDHGAVFPGARLRRRRFRRGKGRAAAQQDERGADGMAQVLHSNSLRNQLLTGASRLHGACSLGALPRANGTSTALSQPLPARKPVCGSMRTNSMLSGTGGSSGAGSRLAIRRPHTVSAPLAPVRPVGLLSSRPTHTTASLSPVKPANQLSRRSSVVPVLPATLSSGGSHARRLEPVPSRTACCSAVVVRKAAAGSTTWLRLSG